MRGNRGTVKIIFLNRFFHPDHSATSQMLSDLAFALAAERREVHIVASRQRYDDPTAELAARETVGGVRVHRVWSTRFGRSDLAGRALDYMTFCAAAASALARLARRGDVVVAKTDPPMFSVVTQPVARWRGAHAVNWLQDIFPEVATALGVGRGGLGRIGVPLLRVLRDRSLRQSAANVALGEHMAQHLRRLGIDAERIAVIPNWADGSLIVPGAHADNPLRSEWAGTVPFVVAYSGNLGRAHDITTILDAMARTGPRVLWLFIGGGAQYEELARQALSRGLTSFRTEPYQPRERLAQSLTVADAHLVSLRPELEGLIVPSKFYGVAAAGRATIFIGDADGEIARELRRIDGGLVVGQGDGAALADAVLTLAAEPDRCRVMGSNARRAFEQDYDKSRAVARWQRLIDKVVAAGRDHDASGAAASPARIG